MQTSSRPGTTIGRGRPPASIPKVDLKSLLSSLRPELLRNPLLAPPQRASLVPRRPSCLKQRSQRPPSAVLDSTRNRPLALASFTSRAKSYTLLTATYSQAMTRKHAEQSHDEDAVPWPSAETGEPLLTSENSSVMIDKKQLAAALAPGGEISKSAMRNRPPQIDLWEKEITGDALTMKNLPIKTANFRAHRVIHSAHPSKPPLGRTISQCEGLMLSPKIQVRSTRMAVVTHMYLEPESDPSDPPLSPQHPVPICNRAKRLRKTKTMTTFGTQTQEDGKKGRIDIYFPEDVKFLGSSM